MKLVFLDIDGVLNSWHFFHAQRKKLGDNWDDCTWEERMLDPENVRHLNAITEATGARIVISSSWRHGHPIDDLRRMLSSVGVTGKIIGMTPDTAPKSKLSSELRRLENVPDDVDGFRCRGDEIQAWLDEHPAVTEFVILDDDCDMGHLLDRLVRTSMEHGLGPEHVVEAVAMFGRMP